jgi:hypothetical protein
VNLRVDLKIDDDYVPDMNQRLMVYRKIAAARSEKELGSALDEIRDRYGAPPDSVLNLAEYGRIRIMADRIGVDSIDREGRLVVIKFRPNARIDPVRLVKVVSEWPGTTLVPPVSMKLDLEAPLEQKKAPPMKTGPLKGGPHRPKRADAGTSWWTARATTGEVRPGFTKEEILRKPEADPRAEGGMFSRLGGLLGSLNVLKGQECPRIEADASRAQASVG